MRPVKNSLPALLLLAPLLLLAACSGASKRLLSPDAQVRAMALDEVLKSDEKTRKKAALRMKKILAKKDSPYRLYAASALEDLGPSAAPAVPELIAALAREDLAASAAERTLEKLGAAAPALLEALKSKDPALRREAAHILPALGAGAAAGLAKNLDGEDAALAGESARILGEIGPEAAAAVPALARAAFSGKNGLKTAASSALVKIGPPAGKWLAAALEAPELKIRAGAAQVLAGMQPPSPEAAAALASALADPDAGLRARAAEALAAYPPATQALFPENFIAALVHAARAPDEPSRNWACITLVRTGAPAGKWLAAALKAPVPATRAGAALVLARMSPPPREAAEAALAALKDGDTAVRAAAAEALANYAVSAVGALPPTASQELIGAFKDKDPAIRAAVIFPLGRLAAGDALALEALVYALHDRDLEVKKSAAEALGALGPAARKALPALWHNLKDRDCAVRALSAQALPRIRPSLKKDPKVGQALKGQCRALTAAPLLKPVTTLTEKTALPATSQLALPGTYEKLNPAASPPPAAH